MRITRYVLVPAAPIQADDLAVQSLAVPCSGWSRLRELQLGWLLVRCEFNSVKELLAAQQVAEASAAIVLPSLQSPADRLPQALKDWIEARGVTIDPGDTVLNVLRKLRDAHPGHFFDVSLPD